MKKDFDCVEMKREAQEKIRDELRGMTREQELAYWAEQARRLREEQRRARGEPSKKTA